MCGDEDGTHLGREGSGGVVAGGRGSLGEVVDEASGEFQDLIDDNNEGGDYFSSEEECCLEVYLLRSHGGREKEGVLGNKTVRGYVEGDESK